MYRSNLSRIGARRLPLDAIGCPAPPAAIGMAVSERTGRAARLVYMAQHVVGMARRGCWVRTMSSWGLPPLRIFSPVPHQRATRKHRNATSTLLAIVAASMLFLAMPLTVGLASNSPHADTDSHAQDWYMVNDHAGVLDEDQERSAINDTYRLNVDGIPTQVVTENVELNQAQANARAEELRISHGIESAPGADDGVLLYLAVDPGDRRSMTMALSAGANALPVNGLTATTLQETLDDIGYHQIAEGKPARAIVYSLREMIYLEQYVPPAVEPVTGFSKALLAVLVVVAPLAAIGGIAWMFRSLKSSAALGKPELLTLIACGLIALGIVLLSIPSHSTIGVFAGTPLGIATIGVAIWLDGRTASDNRRVLTVTPRPKYRDAREVAK